MQIIELEGEPAFAVVPYNEWVGLLQKKDENVSFPDKVVGYHFDDGLSFIAAWRKYKDLSQKELAQRLGITQSAMAQIENPDSKPQKRTLAKVAEAMGLSVEQLTLDD